MSSDADAVRPGPWADLRRFAEPTTPAEQCELCGAGLAAEHPHLVEPATRKLLCACDACAILFDHHSGLSYRRVPRQVRYLEDFRMTDVQWNALQIPIGLAFLFHSSLADKVVAMYPSPAGATESLLNLGSWDDLLQCNPVLMQMEPDTEALLVNRIGADRQHYLAPIDECYRLVGVLRARWRGLSGGSEVWQRIAEFFESLKQRAC